MIPRMGLLAGLVLGVSAVPGAASATPAAAAVAPRVRISSPAFVQGRNTLAAGASRPAGDRVASGVPDGSGGAFVLRTDYIAGVTEYLSQTWVLRLTEGPSAGWPAVGVEVSAGAGSQDSPLLCSDGSRGVIVAWADYTTSRTTIRAQRIGSAGARMWLAAGESIASDPGFRYLSSVISDGAGGALIAWSEGPIPDSSRVYVARVTPSGAFAPGWPAGGLPVAGAPGTQNAPQLVSDGTGGALVTWIDSRTQAPYGQHLSAGGVSLWGPDGLPLAASNDYGAASDGAGGMLITWSAQPGTPSTDVFVQRVNDAGTALWAPGGVVVCQASGEQLAPQILGDGLGGAYIAWEDFRGALAGPVIYASRVDSKGIRVQGWQPDGTQISPGAIGGEPMLVADLDQGFFVAWEGLVEDSYVTPRLYATHVTDLGTISPGWTSGVEMTGPGSQFDYLSDVPTPDGAGGLIATWWDRRGTDPGKGLYGQHLDASGAKIWATDGMPITTYRNTQSDPVVARSGSGAFVRWQQYELGGAGDFFQQFDGTGAPSGARKRIADSGSGGPFVAADLVGGMFAAWIDSFGGVRLQHYDSQGNAAGNLAGVTLPGGIGQRPLLISLIPDGRGGAILAWLPGGGNAIHAARVNPDGYELWGDGVIAGAADGVYIDPGVLVGDGTGGAFLIWTRLRSGPGDPTHNVVVQRVDSAGTNRFGTDGVFVADAPVFQDLPTATADGEGGVIVVWSSGPVFQDEDMVAQRITADGVPAVSWPPGGVAVTAPGRQLFPRAAGDGAGGAVVGWWDGRSGEYRTYLQHLDASGNPTWLPADGVPVAGTPGNQLLDALIPDQDGGTIAAWTDGRGSSWDLYAQRFGPDGTPYWAIDGAEVCAVPFTQTGARLEADGLGGAFVVWEDGRTPPIVQTLVQHLTAGGQAAWTGGGVTEILADLVSAAFEGGVVTLEWRYDGVDGARLERAQAQEDWRPVTRLLPDGTGRLHYVDRDVVPGERYRYRLRIDRPTGPAYAGEATVEIPVLTLALEPVRPNPVSGPMLATFTLPRSGAARFEVMDISGRLVAQRSVGGLGPGRHTMNLGRMSGAKPGVYWLQIAQDGQIARQRFVLIR